MTKGSGVEKSVSQAQFLDTIEKVSANITHVATNIQVSLDAGIAKLTDQVDQLWEKASDHAEHIARIAETSEKLDTFFVRKFLRKKDVDYDDANPQPDGSLNLRVRTIKPVGKILVKVVPPNSEGGGNQFEQAPLRINELVTQVGA